MARRIANYLIPIFAGLVFLAASVPGETREPGSNPQGSTSGQESLRGIEKKDIRIFVLYDESETPSEQAAALTRAATADAVASGAKLTKADAARAAGTATPVDDSPLVFLSAAKQNAEDCSQPGCVKSDMGCFCFRLLDVDKVVLSDIPVDEPVLTGPIVIKGKGSSTGGTGGRLASPKRTVILVLGDSLPKKLSSPDWWKRNRAWFEQEVWAKIKASPTTTNVTIKTKSSPP
ncbi:MAG: hypothetical protein K6U09_07600 [Acidobacteriia bacterium]|jgi:hypothetical protein|nr:hypothetical protein [Terriglobia bacterium]